MRCKDYMYREKWSAKLNKVLASLKEHVSQKKTEHACNITFLSQLSNDLIALISFFLSCSFHWAFQAHFIKRFKSISSCRVSLKQTHFWFKSIAFNKACFVHVIQADSLSSDELSQWDQSLSSIRVYYTHVAKLFRSCLLHSIELVSFMFTTCM